MKLFNVVIGFDLWVVAPDRASAISTAKAVVAEGADSPNECYAYDVVKAKDIPPRVQGVFPFVTEEVIPPLEKKGVDLDNDDVATVFNKIVG